MTGIEILDVVICLIIVYSLLSLLATSVNEIIVNTLSLCDLNLKEAIRFFICEDMGKFDINLFMEDPMNKNLNTRPIMGRWRITAFAISFDSPFWFDLLKRVNDIKLATQQQAEKEQSSAGSKI